MSAYASVIAFRLASRLEESGRAKDVGQAVTEVLFQLPSPRERARRPDAAFVSFERWAKGRPIPGKDNAWRVVPNLAVEVVSPHDFAEELLEKIEEYFHAGVEVVWVVYPRQQFVHVYESITQIRVVPRAGELEGGAVLPDFRLPLADIFREETTPA